MKIGGLNSFSVSDFPGRVSAVVFTQGCNFRCRFCHNGFLIPQDVPLSLLIPEKNVLDFIERRCKQLDGVVVSGGEPTIQPDLPIFLEKIKTMGLAVKLDTNGGRPAVLRDLLQKDLVDYIAMDVKAPLASYKTITGMHDSKVHKIKESIELIAKSGVEHEFRTTVVELYLSYFDMRFIKKLIPPGSPHRLQKFYPDHALDPSLRKMTKIIQEQNSHEYSSRYMDFENGKRTPDD